MLSSLKMGATSPSLVRVLASRFSTLNPMAEAQRVEEIRNVLNSVSDYYRQDYGQVVEPYTNLPLKKLNWIKNIKPTERGVSFNVEMISNAYPKYDEVLLLLLFSPTAFYGMS